MKGYDQNNPNITKDLVKQASKNLFTYVYLKNSDHDTDGSTIHNLNSNKSLRNDQYTRTIVETSNALSNHKSDNNINKKKCQKNARTKNNKEKQEDEESTPVMFVKTEGICYRCRKPGHNSTNFRTKSKMTRQMSNKQSSTTCTSWSCHE